MSTELAGKVALVTGASRGLGRAIAVKLASMGAKVAVNYLSNDAEAANTVTAISQAGGEAATFKASVSDSEAVKNMVRQVVDKWGKIDILVNNAGASVPTKPFIAMTRAEWDFVIGVNLYGQMNVAHAVLPHMISRHYGRIVSISGGMGFPLISVYGAAKAGVVAFTQSLSKEVASQGIIANAVVPGLALTGLVKDADPEFLKAFRENSSLKRFCTPDDLAPVVAFLASDVCSYMVGQVLYLGGS
jgi:3-oxoacyl-[acyl-carrier protein] reductase